MRPRNICKFNHNFFNKIDSEEKAYWLGFIMADGVIIDKVISNSHISNVCRGRDKSAGGFIWKLKNY